MTLAKTYTTAGAFRRALEDRLTLRSRQGAVDLQRLRRQVAFDRLLGRFFSSDQAPWVLKGGYAMELRLDSARSTRDVDLTLRSTDAASKNPKTRNNAIFDLLERYAAIDLKDFFVYRIGQTTMNLDSPLYGGARYPVEARLDGRLFTEFHVDVAVGDILIEPLEEIQGKDWLAFAGISKITLFAISSEQQFAEKLHAYTIPRKNPNSRVRDLVDMVLLIESSKLSKESVRQAIDATYSRRKTHPVPKKLLPPPADWTKRFAAMADESGISANIEDAFQLVKSFFDARNS